MRAKNALVATGIAAAVLSAPAAAMAATVFQGDDRAYNTGTTKVTVCDGEVDGHSAYSDYRGSTNARIQTSGGAGTCASATLSRLSSFDVCELITAFPDPFSSRVYI